MENKKRALGKGLEQLFDTDNINVEEIEDKIYESSTNEEIIDIPLEELRPNPYQPRKEFDDEALKELSESIKTHGVFQPIIVKKSIKGYEVIAGERRLRASKDAGLETIPAIVRPFNDEQMMEIAILENLQRENLNPMEEAKAYKQMIERLSLTQDQLSKRLGKSRVYITNMLGLLRLPIEVQKMVTDEKISMSHAKILSKLEDEHQIIEIANKIDINKLPVHEVESLTSEEKYKKKNKITRKPQNTEYKYVEELLREKLDSKVKVKDRKIEIEFTNDADLNRILEIIDVKE